MQEGWFRSRWWEFRLGHSTYLIFLLTFVNFILISYRLLIERIPFLQEIIPELWIFMVLFLVIYIPASIGIGFWHRKTQLKVENTLGYQENPVLAKMFRVMLDVKTGTATKEEIEEFRKFLVKIERKFAFTEKK
jgi:hypothetical protein